MAGEPLRASAAPASRLPAAAELCNRWWCKTKEKSFQFGLANKRGRACKNLLFNIPASLLETHPIFLEKSDRIRTRFPERAREAKKRSSAKHQLRDTVAQDLFHNPQTISFCLTNFSCNQW